MTKVTGLFTRKEVKRGKKKNATLGNMRPEQLWRIGTKGVARMNPSAMTPEMSPHGSSKPQVYFLGLAPTPTDDVKGVPFSEECPAGKLVRKYIPRDYLRRSRFSHIVRTTLPEERHENWFERKPLPVEVECFRTSVRQDIMKHKPAALVCLGPEATQWATGLTKGINGMRGRRFPVQWEGHSMWVYPVQGVDHLYEKAQSRAKYNQRVGTHELCFQWDLQRVWRDLSLFKDKPRVEALDGLYRGVHWVTNATDVFRHMNHLRHAGVLAVDIETTHLRPYHDDAAILSIAFGTEDYTVAFPVHHPRFRWGKQQPRIEACLLDVLLNNECVFHNLSFDLEWLAQAFTPTIVRSCVFHDTMQAAYTLDPRQGTHSLEFLAVQEFGLHLKEQSNVDRKKLLDVDVEKLLKYNALDVKYTHKLYKVLSKRVKEEGLQEVYHEQVDRVLTLAKAQLGGFPVSQPRVHKFRRRYEARQKMVEHKLKELPEVVEYERRFGEFNPNSDDQLKRVYKDVIGKPPLLGGKVSMKEEALKASGGKLGKLILENRRVTKMLSTYIKPLIKGSESTVVWPDGKLHTNFNTTFTVTGRLSSDSPNMQNYPKRDPELKRIRRCLVPGPGQAIVSVDYGQIEFRVIGMASKDKNIIDALWNDYDVHMHWAERLAEQYPDTMEKRHGKRSDPLKAFRSDVKNQWVFPAFYGSAMRSCARNLDIPEEELEPVWKDFWKDFRGVKRWQEKLLDFYNRKHYVEALTGRRRHAPLTGNEAINAPVQGTASDIVVDAMNRLSVASEVRGLEWLQPVLNIHDDLTFLVPDDELDACVRLITRYMVDVPWAWARVCPIVVEVEVGRDWYSMEEWGKVSSSWERHERAA